MEYFIPEHIKKNPEKVAKLLKIYNLLNKKEKSKAILISEKNEVKLNTTSGIYHFINKNGYWFLNNKRVKIKELGTLTLCCDICNNPKDLSGHYILKREHILCKSCKGFFCSCKINRHGNSNNMSSKSVCERLNITPDDASIWRSDIIRQAKATGESPDTRLYWIKKGYSEEEVTDILSGKKPQSKKYWIKKGYSEEDAIYKAKSCNPLTKEYYQIRGLSLKDRELFIKETAASLENYIKWYGEVDGSKKWQEKKDKCSGTLENYIKWYGEEEGSKKWQAAAVARQAGRNGATYSKISQQLFTELNNIIKINDFLFAEKNKEFFLKNASKIHFYDFTDLSSKKIIEFNGDFWHANPEKYKKGDTINLPNRKNYLVEEIWTQDKEKNDFAKSRGFDVLVIWEAEYRNDKEGTIQKCLEFLLNEN